MNNNNDRQEFEKLSSEEKSQRLITRDNSYAEIQQEMVVDSNNIGPTSFWGFNHNRGSSYALHLYIILNNK